MIRYSFYILTGLLCLFLFLFPFMIKPELSQREFHFQQGNHNRVFSQDSVYQSGKETGMDAEIYENAKGMKKSSVNEFKVQSDENRDIQVFGYMTISELAEEYNLQALDICRELNIPSEEINERIGRLKRDYGFEMEVLRKYVEKETNRIKHHKNN